MERVSRADGSRHDTWHLTEPLESLIGKSARSSADEYRLVGSVTRTARVFSRLIPGPFFQ